MAKTKTVREIPFVQIEDQFKVVPLRLGLAMYPAVSFRAGEGYSIRVLKSETRSGANVSTTYDYLRTDAEGNVTEAPRGYAKEFKPGRIPVEELQAAVAKYAQAVIR